MLSRQHVIQKQNTLPWAHFQITRLKSKSDSNFFLTLFQRAPSVFHLSVSRFNKTLNSTLFDLQVSSWWSLMTINRPRTNSVPFQAAGVAGCPGETGPQGTEAGGPSDHSKERADSLKMALHDWRHHSKDYHAPPPTWFPEKTKQRKIRNLTGNRDKKQNV